MKILGTVGLRQTATGFVAFITTATGPKTADRVENYGVELTFDGGEIDDILIDGCNDPTTADAIDAMLRTIPVKLLDI